MIGIIGGMEIEVKRLISSLTEVEETRISGSVFFRGKLNGTEVVVARSGIGKVAAAVIAEAMILRFAPDLVISTGVGGALSPDLSIGDVVISDRVIQHDMDTSAVGDPVGFLSGIDRIHLDADPEAVRRAVRAAQKANMNAMIGTIATGDQFIDSTQKKQKILSHFPDAVLCEMEGGAIAHAAYLNQTGFLILRTVSDTSDERSSVDYPTFVAMAADRLFQMVVAFLSIV